MTSKTFIASVLSLALIITGISAPRAQAMDEDAIAALLFGVTALAVIGAAVADERKHKPAPVTPVAPKPVKPKDKKKKAWLPRHCANRFEAKNGRIIQGYGQRCLFRTQYPAYRLPEACYFKIKGVHGPVAGYRTQCLKKKGYKVVWR